MKVWRDPRQTGLSSQAALMTTGSVPYWLSIGLQFWL
jgi:hypothetical protein